MKRSKNRREINSIYRNLSLISLVASRSMKASLTRGLTSGMMALLLATMSMTLTACDPAADHTLSREEKEADMKWLFSIFGNNYAPLEYKEARYHIDFDRLKSLYLSRATRAKSNDEFYRVMAQFVAEFHDAHTAGSISPAQVPGQAQLAYLGFSGVRDGTSFRVTGFFPTINKSTFAVQDGDKITHIDGVPIFEYIDQNLTPYRDLGNPLANKTMHMNNLFTRLSLNFPIPKKDNVTLTIERTQIDPAAPKVTRVSLPWIKKDIYDFRIEQALFKASQTGAKSLSLTDPDTHQELSLNILDQRGVPIPVSSLIESYQNRQKSFTDSFQLRIPTSISLSGAAPTAAPEPTGYEKLKLERKIPENAISIEEAKAFPAYFYSVDVKDSHGHVRGSKKVGYVRIDSFEPQGVTEDQAIEQLRSTLKKFKNNGVTSVIVDTIDNPGGSLELAARTAQAFSDKKIHLADMQFGLNDNWLLQLQKNSLQGSDEQRERYRRLYQELRAEKNQGKRISKTYNMSDILTAGDPNYGVSFDKILILTSEMNASCGDIFPAILQDNDLGIVIGNNTMGAGGNVVDHRADQAPNGHFAVRQTESLIVRKDGSYLENNGVKPDVEFDVNSALSSRYNAVQNKAENVITDREATTKKYADQRADRQSKPVDETTHTDTSAPEQTVTGAESADDRAARRTGGLTSPSTHEDSAAKAALEAVRRARVR